VEGGGGAQSAAALALSLLWLLSGHLTVFRVSDTGIRISGFGFRVSGFGFRISGFGFRVLGLEVRGWGTVSSSLGLVPAVAHVGALDRRRRAPPAEPGLKRFRGGLVVKAHRHLYHSTLGLRVITKKNTLVWG